MCVKTEEKEGEKKGWKREKEGERLRGIEDRVRKYIGNDKRQWRSMEV